MAEKNWFEKAQQDAMELDPTLTREAETFINQTEKKNSWITFIGGMVNKIRKEYPSRILIPIIVKEPPCVSCKHWMPRVGNVDQTEEIWVRMCWKEDQCQDFSCFEEK